MPADLLIVNARVRTLDPERPSADAVAVRDGVIVAVGDEAAVREEAGGAAEVVDVGGAALVPGLVDAHTHPFHGTDIARGVDLRGARDFAEVRRRLEAGVAALRDGEWLLAANAYYEPFAETGLHADVVDEIAGGRPAVIRFFDAHTVLAGRGALAAAGIDGPRQFIQRAQVVCDADGRPTGELREWAAIGLLDAAVPPPADPLAAYAATLRDMNANGLTGTQVMLGRPALFDDIDRLEGSGRLSLRLRVPVWLQPETTDEEVEAYIAQRDRGGRRWEAGTAKFFGDGVVETGTAWLHGGDAAGRNEEAFWPVPGSYETRVRQMAEAGFQCITHAVGDGAVHAALDAYAASPRAASGAPHRIEHLETLRDEELTRLAAEGVAASMQPLHMMGLEQHDLDARFPAALGKERLRLAFRWADVRRSGAILALGSDWPVADHDPRAGMAWARLRRTPGDREGTPFFAEQALTALQALEGYTTHAALAAGEQDVAGRIAPGFRADLTALAEDPVECDADDLPSVPVVLTVVDGEVVFRAG
jgi:predicted amidohydrolase YtcJ